jgi:hypothetical protein
MSSVERAASQLPSNKLYINIGAIQSSIVDTNLERVSWVTQVGALSTAGAVVLRDMGKTVYLPGASSGSATQSTILRKVQLVPSGAQGFNGTGGAAGTSSEFFTGYVDIGAQTYGGGNGTPAKIARLN